MKKILATLLLFTIFLSCTAKFPGAERGVKVDKEQKAIYYGGNIITMEGDTPQYAEAVVQIAGKIVFVGSKKEAIERYRDEAAKVNLTGKTMLPAFLDGHGHFYNVGFMALTANLLPPPDGPGQNHEGITTILTEYKNSEDGQYLVNKLGWIIGSGYDDSQLEEKEHPTASDLDKVSTEHPIVIIHQSGHLAVVNSKALELIGYDKNTEDPKGGTIRRDAEGNPNGVLEETAFFYPLIPLLGKIDKDVAVKSIKKGQEEYAAKGYLTAQDGRSTPDQLAALKEGARNSAFYLDVVVYPDITLGTDYISGEDFAPSRTYKNRLRIGGVKLTLDGSPQGKTAWLTDCYLVNPAGRTGCYKGYPIMDDKEAREYIQIAYQNQWQLLVHTNGDAAIDQYLNALSEVQKDYGYPDPRTVMIHGQTLRKDQIPDLLRLQVMPSLFPMHTFYWGDWHAESVLGQPRADYISPSRDVIDAGLKMTSHHDAPVTLPNSMRVLDATVNRVTRSGRILGKEQRITPYEGLMTLTSWAAYQYFEEDRKGTLRVGKLADFVILDKNPLKIDPMKIHSIEVVESIKEGKTVYTKG